MEKHKQWIDALLFRTATMKKRDFLIVLTVIAVGFAVTSTSGLYKQTSLPKDLMSGTIETWYGVPFGWTGYSQVGHVYFFNPPYWFSLISFLLDVVFWSLISSMGSYVILGIIKAKQERKTTFSLIKS
jgi:hypothetical protein